MASNSRKKPEISSAELNAGDAGRFSDDKGILARKEAVSENPSISDKAA
ncbi:MAG: hypothetical protein GY899_13965 [Verrucomicrobiaceae bacterium]|nr:hypothetical protein [Verrucomicrobiaceae bacterium]